MSQKDGILDVADDVIPVWQSQGHQYYVGVTDVNQIDINNL